MRKPLLKTLISGFSFASALFVFQACYGMPQDMLNDLYISGQVVSQSSGLPVEGIKVEADEFMHYGLTNSDGFFEFYTPATDSLKLSIEDTDPASNGDFISKDTLLINPDYVILNIALEER